MKKLLLLGIMLLGLGGVSSVKAQGGTKTPLLLLKNGAINTTDFDITPIGTSTLTTDNLYAATFKSKNGNPSNTFQYKNLNVKDYDKAIVKYTIEAGNGEWKIFLPNGSYTTLPEGTDQVYEVDLSDVDTYGDFTVFSWFITDKSITISEVYLYKSSFVEFEFDAIGKGTVDKKNIKKLTATGGLTYDPSTGALSSDGTAGSLVLEFATPVDMRNLFQFNVENTGKTGEILSRLEFYDEDNSLINTWNGIKLGNLSYVNGIDDNATNAFLNHKPVKKMVWPSDANASNKGKTATITSVAFICKTISCAKAGETILKSLPYQNMSGASVDPAWNVLNSTDTYYGTSDGTNAASYTDITGYSELRIYRDNNTGFRAFFIDAAGTKVNTINHENAASSWNAEGKYWSIDLSKVEKYGEKVALQGIKSAAWGQNNVVNNIVVYKTPAANAPQYSLAGSGLQLAETVAALADATATCIDATGVKGLTTDTEVGRTLLTSANPNCLFLGTTGNGGLANTKNVMVGTTIANLELTDGYPFAVPSGATATAATYTRSMSNKYGTVCLPYEVASTDAVKYYTIKSLAANELTLKEETTLSAGTPAIVEMVSGSSITATGSGALAEAGAPTDNLKLIGTYEAKTILASDYAGKGIYAISNNQFVQATTSINLPAFRAFFTAAPAESNIRLVFDDDATAIDALSGEGDVTIEGIYSLDGAEMPSLQKGINVVKFSNGEVKKVIVK